MTPHMCGWVGSRLQFVFGLFSTEKSLSNNPSTCCYYRWTKDIKTQSHLNQKKSFQVGTIHTVCSISHRQAVSTSRKTNSRPSRCANKWNDAHLFLWFFALLALLLIAMCLFYPYSFLLLQFFRSGNHVHSHQNTFERMKRMSEAESWSGQSAPANK